MTISFDSTPANIRVPFFAVEFSSELASQGAQVQPYKILYIGQKLAAGTAAANTPQRVTSAGQAKTLFGRGSMLARMVEIGLGVNNFTESWAVALPDDGAAAAATGTLAFTGPATAAGTLVLYVAGQRLTIGVNSGDTATAIAAAVAAAINAALDLPVTASATTGTVTVTGRNKGEAANYIDLAFNYQTGEAFPNGVAVTITAMHGGTQNPDLSAMLAALGDVQYNHIAMPYTDSNALTDLEAELLNRWGPMRPIDGMAWAAADLDYATLATLGNSRNSQFVTIMGAYAGPNPPYEWAAAYAAAGAFNLNVDPARQLRTIPLTGLMAPPQASLFTLTERNLLLYDGISTFTVDAGGIVRIERAITTYKTNAVGANDPSYLDVMTVTLLSYLRYDWRNYMMLKYPRHKLADDGTRYGAGQAIITPKIGKAEMIARFRVWEDLGLVENADQFKADLVCERNASDPNRLDWLGSPDLINNFMVGATKIDFLLQGNDLTS